MTQIERRGFTAYVFAVLAMSAVSLAASPVADALAVIGEVDVSASAIQWTASGQYDRLTLTVSGPEGFTFRREFETGGPLTLRIADLRAKSDGSYTWELRVVPRVSSETKQKLAEARAADDDQAIARIQAEEGLDRAVTRSGAFMILGGSFVTNSATE